MVMKASISELDIGFNDVMLIAFLTENEGKTKCRKMRAGINRADLPESMHKLHSDWTGEVQQLWLDTDDKENYELMNNMGVCFYPHWAVMFYDVEEEDFVIYSQGEGWEPEETIDDIFWALSESIEVKMEEH